ncbi:MAG: lipopolysaccharide biosynthesis protein, partial [Isosphaeraceae bacterium]
NRSSLGVGLGAVQEIPVLRASGRVEEARRLADVAYTTNTLTCLIYAAGLVAWALWRAPFLDGDPLAAEWTWGLVAVAGLTLVKRYESFLVAVLRAHREFTLTAELDVVESLVSAGVVGLGLWLAGFWGLLVAVGVLLIVKIAYAHARHPFRFRWRWEVPTAWRLMRVGLPILMTTALHGALLSVDRVVILSRFPDGARAAGLYSIALAGTGWALDLSGRIVQVVYNAFQTTLGRTNDPAEVARQAARTTEAQAPPLLAGSAGAYLAGPSLLGLLMPRYAEGLPALRPLLPGMTLISLAWPCRQFLIAVGQPYRLGLATVLGLLVTTYAAIAGADAAGLVGLAWGVSLGFTTTFLVTNGVALVPWLGWTRWLKHMLRIGLTTIVVTLATLVVTHVPLGLTDPWIDLTVRVGALGAGSLTWLAFWGRRHGWGGLLKGRGGSRDA